MLWVVGCEMFLSVDADLQDLSFCCCCSAAAAACHDFVVDNVQYREFVIFGGV